MSPATPIRNSVSCARIFRAVSAGLPRTIRRANMPKFTATTVTNEIGQASPAILAAVRCDSPTVLIVISFPPKRSGAAGCQALLFDSKVITTFPRACPPDAMSFLHCDRARGHIHCWTIRTGAAVSYLAIPPSPGIYDVVDLLRAEIG